MSLTSGLIPLGSKPTAKKSPADALDFEINDDDLDDLLGLDTENDFKKPKPATTASKSSFDSLNSNKKGLKSNLFDDPNIPSSRTSLPKSQTSDSNRLSAVGKYSAIPDPSTLKPKKDEDIDKKDFGALLSKIGDMDDMDDGLFSGTGLVSKKTSVKGGATVKGNLTDSPYKDPFASTTTDSPFSKPAISHVKDNDTWSSISNENGRASPYNNLGNLPSTQTAGLFDKPVMSKAPAAGKHSNTDDDDLLETMGLSDTSKSKISINSANIVAKPNQTNFGFEVKGSSFSAEPTFKTGFSEVGHTRVLAPQNDQIRSISPASIKSKEEDFIPTFLAEASSGRRRRGPAPGSSSAANANASMTDFPPKSDDLDLGFLKDTQRLAIHSSKEPTPNDNVSKAHAKNPLIASVTSQLSRNASSNYGSVAKDSSLGLPFLDPKPKSVELKAPFESVGNTTTTAMPKLESVAFGDSNPTKSAKSTHLELPKPSLSKSSSLSSIVSLGPTDDELDTSDNEKLSVLKEKKKAATPTPQAKSAPSPIQSVPSSSKSSIISGLSQEITPPAVAGPLSNRPSQTATKVESKEESISAQSADLAIIKKERDSLTRKIEEEETIIKTLQDKNRLVEERVSKLSKEVEDEKSQLKEAQKKLAEAEAKLNNEKAVHEMLEEVKRQLTEEHTREIELMKETHALDLETAIKLEKQLISETVKMEIAKCKAEHEKTIALLKSKHFDEMSNMISTADAAQQLETLVHKMEESSQLVDAMHHKLETDHSYSVKEREMALQLKERQLVELQRQIMKQHQSLEEERLKLKAKSDTTDTILEEMKREREDDQRAVDEERRNLENQISIVRTERDLIQRQLHRERLEFVRQKEAWTMERKKQLMASSDEQQALAMEKAIIEAKREAVVEVEMEMERLKGREEAQIHADRLMLEKEAHTLAIKRADLHREAAELRTERLALETEKQKLEAEKEAFEKGWKVAETRVKMANDVHHSAADERLKAETLDAEVRKTLQVIQNQKLELEESKRSLEAERILLAKTKQRIVDDRILLAHERTQKAIESDSYFSNIQKPVYVTTEKLLQTVNDGIQKASTKNVGVMPRTQTTKTVPLTPPALITNVPTTQHKKPVSASLFEAAKIKREIEDAQRAKKIALTLKRYATEVKENNATGIKSP
ncbi:hypothetical protein HDU79_009130 [Rhizoclosmatium sp. JEL0117]|nr:hypothetical protein HDU79_009130 [Rhizoclosmatium sp. JEL0117]